jgi:hypothetical protein
MDEQNVLYTKEGFNFVKHRKNNYSLSFEMKNNNIILANIIDFTLVKLIYDLNGDIYEKIDLNKINDNEVIMSMLVRHLFEELGLPQRFSYVHMTKNIEQNKITFISQSIYSERPQGMPSEAEQMPLKNMICSCDILTPHHIGFKCDITFEDKMIVPPFVEKMIGLILFKIFNRVKGFIENVRM